MKRKMFLPKIRRLLLVAAAVAVGYSSHAAVDYTYMTTYDYHNDFSTADGGTVTYDPDKQLTQDVGDAVTSGVSGQPGDGSLKASFSGNNGGAIRAGAFSLSPTVPIAYKGVVEFDYFASNATNGSGLGHIAFCDVNDVPLFVLHTTASGGSGSARYSPLSVGLPGADASYANARIVPSVTNATLANTGWKVGGAAGSGSGWIHIKVEYDYITKTMKFYLTNIDGAFDSSNAAVAADATPTEFPITITIPDNQPIANGVAAIKGWGQTGNGYSPRFDNLAVDVQDVFNASVAGISINGRDDVERGKSINLVAAISPLNAPNEVTWTSKHGLVTIAPTGPNSCIVTAGAALGFDTLVVAATDGSGVSISWPMTVTPVMVHGITISGQSGFAATTIPADGIVATYKVAIENSDAENKAVSWAICEDLFNGVAEKVSATDSTLTLKMTAFGVDTITATAKDGSGTVAKLPLVVEASPYKNYDYVNLFSGSTLSGGAITAPASEGLALVATGGNPGGALAGSSGNLVNGTFTMAPAVSFNDKVTVEFDYLGTTSTNGNSSYLLVKDTVIGRPIFALNTAPSVGGSSTSPTRKSVWSLAVPDTTFDEGSAIPAANLITLPIYFYGGAGAGGGWVHVKAEVDNFLQTVTVAITNISAQVETGVPDDTTVTHTIHFPKGIEAYKSATSLYFYSKSSYWHPYVDNLGVESGDVKNLDSITVVPQSPIVNSYGISMGDSVKYQVTFYPSDAACDSVVWSLAQNNGTVLMGHSSKNFMYLIANQTGVDTLIATSADKRVVKRVPVGVDGILVKSISINGAGVKIIYYSANDTTMQLGAAITPTAPAPTYPVVWSSSNAAVATVDQSGLVKLTGAAGTDTIKVKATDIGGLEAIYVFTVVLTEPKLGWFDYSGYDYIDLMNSGEAGTLNGTIVDKPARGSTWSYDPVNKWLNISGHNASGAGRRQYYEPGKMVTFSEKLRLEFDFFPSGAPDGAEGLEAKTTFMDNAYQDILTIYQPAGEVDSLHIAVGPLYSENFTRTWLSGTGNNDFGGVTPMDNYYMARKGAKVPAERRYTCYAATNSTIGTGATNNWYHFRVTIDLSTNRVSGIITVAQGIVQVGTQVGSFDLPLPDGFVFVDGIYRILHSSGEAYNYQQRLDNIGIKNLDTRSAEVKVNNLEFAQLAQTSVPTLMFGTSSSSNVAVPLPQMLPSDRAGSVLVGQTSTLYTIAKPITAANKTVLWSSATPDLATVNESGVVTGVAPGIAKIVATATDGGYTDTCDIEVISQPITDFTFHGDAGFYVGQTQIDNGYYATLLATFGPDGVTDNRVEWTVGGSCIEIVKDDSVSAGGDSVYMTYKIKKFGLDTITVRGINAFRGGATYSESFFVNIKLSPYPGYDYIEQFDDELALNGVVRNHQGGPVSIQVKDVDQASDYSLKYVASSQSGSRLGRFDMLKSRQISWNRKAILEFDFFVDTVVTSNREGKISFVNITQDTTDWSKTSGSDGRWGVDTSAREVISIYNTTNGSGFGVHVGGDVYRSAATSRTYTFFENAFFSNSATKGEFRRWVQAPLEQWYHAKVSIVVGKHVAFEITNDSLDEPIEFALPYPEQMPQSIGQIIMCVGDGSHSWTSAVDNIGIRNADNDEPVPATEAYVSGRFDGNYTVVPEAGSIGLTAVLRPYDVDDYNVTWSTKQNVATTTLKGDNRTFDVNVAGPQTLPQQDMNDTVVFTVDATPGVSAEYPVLVTRVYVDTIDIYCGNWSSSAQTVGGEVRVNHNILLRKRYAGPDNAGRKGVTWHATKPESVVLVPSVTGDSCVVWGKDAGPDERDTLYVVATAADGGNATDSLIVYVQYTHVSSVTVYGAKRLFYTDKPDTTTFTIEPVLNPSTSSDTVFSTYASTDPSILTVDPATGLVTLTGGYGTAAVKVIARDTCLYPNLHEAGATGNKEGFYYITVARESENPYNMLFDFESTDTTAWDADANGIPDTITIPASSGARQSYYRNSIQGTQALYTNLNGGGARDAEFSFDKAISAAADTALHFRADIYLGAPPTVNMSDNPRNSATFTLYTSDNTAIATLMWWRNTADGTQRIRVHSGAYGGWNTEQDRQLPDVYPGTDNPSGWFTNLSALDTWYTMEVTIDNTQRTVSATLTERDRPEYTASAKGLPLVDPSNTKVFDLKRFYARANRDGVSGNGASASCVTAIDNIGYYYTAEKYHKLVLNPNGGKFYNGLGVNDTITVVEGTTFNEFVPTNVTRDGHTFVKWQYENGTDYNSTDPVAASDITLVAQWSIDCYMVTFIGTAITLDPICVNWNDYVTKPNVPARDCYIPNDEGYGDVDWLTTNGDSWDFNRKLTVDNAAGLTLIASWPEDTRIPTCTTSPDVLGVALVPDNVTLQVGSTQQFFAVVKAINGATPEVTWTLTGSDSSTVDATGLLTVHPSDTAVTQLTVTATSVFDATKKASATVLISRDPVAPAVLAVVVTPETVTLEKGATQQFDVVVGTQGGAATTVTWSVSGGASTISPEGLLTVAANETAATLTVTATSTADPGQAATATVTIKKENKPDAVIGDKLVGISLYPNPATTEVTVEGLEGGETITIYDLAGTSLRTIKVNGGTAKLSIPVATLPQGTYLVKVQKAGASATLKMVK